MRAAMAEPAMLHLVLAMATDCCQPVSETGQIWSLIAANLSVKQAKYGH